MTYRDTVKINSVIPIFSVTVLNPPESSVCLPTMTYLQEYCKKINSCSFGFSYDLDPSSPSRNEVGYYIMHHSAHTRSNFLVEDWLRRAFFFGPTRETDLLCGGGRGNYIGNYICFGSRFVWNFARFRSRTVKAVADASTIT